MSIDYYLVSYERKLSCHVGDDHKLVPAESGVDLLRSFLKHTEGDTLRVIYDGTRSRLEELNFTEWKGLE